MDKNQSNNLVFLIDVSSSMSANNKLALLKKSLYMLVDNMGSNDKISIVVYAGVAGLVLPPTSASQKSAIHDAIEGLESGGETAGGQGIELAYKLAKESFIKKGNNRIMLSTDGDFNVGMTNDDDLKDLEDLGSEHTVVAIYEIIQDKSTSCQSGQYLRCQKKIMKNSKHLKDELTVVKFRYKNPKSSRSILIEKIIQYNVKENASVNLIFACDVAEFGMLLRGSSYKGNASFKSILDKAKKGLGNDVHGYRAEFIRLVERAELLMKSYEDMQ